MSNGDEPNGRPQWFELDPGRRTHELRQIQELDADAVDEVEDSQLNILTRARYKGEQIQITIRFPADFPFVAPTLCGPLGTLERHQQPFSGNFCLIDNEDHWWHPHYSARVLLEELQRLLEADERGEVSAGERDVPEPLSAHLSKRDGLVVFIPDGALTANLDQSSGSFELMHRNGEQWVLTKLVGEDGRVLASIDHDLSQRLKLGRTGRVDGNWVGLDTEPSARDALTLDRIALQAMRRGQPAQRGRSRRNAEIWAAVTFSEQAPTREETRRAWLFYEARTGRAGGIDHPGSAVRTQALTKTVRQDRLLELDGLERQRILVVGAGAIGGQLVLELAKAGVGHIDVVDDDIYDIGNAVRHPLDIDSAGQQKSSSIAELAERLNPFSKVEAHGYRLGGTPRSAALADDLVRDADLVVDATGFHSVTRLLHSRCSDNGDKPLVSAALSVGGFGGRIVVLRSASPCFDCFLTDERIPKPGEGESPNRTPYGCTHPAASCAGFDVLELVANTARTVARLAPDVTYPNLDFDWAVVNFRPGGDRWAQGELEPQPGCAGCS